MGAHADKKQRLCTGIRVGSHLVNAVGEGWFCDMGVELDALIFVDSIVIGSGVEGSLEG